MISMRQHEAVLVAMKELGGFATLGQLYQTAPDVPGSTWKTKTPFASIRRIVQTHPEFFRIRRGLWALTEETERIKRLFSTDAYGGRQKEYSHYYYQGLIVEIGNLHGYRTHVPAQDKNKPFAKTTLGRVATAPQMDEFTFQDVVRRARTVDVTWINSRRFPQAFFEIEHSTDISGALVKFVEFQDFRANLHIVADARRRREFDDKLGLAAFTPIKAYVKFWDYDAVAELHTKLSASVLAQRVVER